MGNRRIVRKCFLGYSQLGLKSIQTSNVYAEMVFNVHKNHSFLLQVLGTGGYRFYVVFSLITLYGSNIGSVVQMESHLQQQIAMAGFLENMTFFGKNETSRKIVIQIFITIICIVLCLLKDPSQLSPLVVICSVLVPISSSGLIAIIASYLILIMFHHVHSLILSYGMSKYKPSFEAKDLWPESASALLENIGIYVYCMGFILFLLTQYVIFLLFSHHQKYIRRDCRKTVVRSTGVSISLMALIYIFIGIILSQYYKNSGSDHDS